MRVLLFFSLKPGEDGEMLEFVSDVWVTLRFESDLYSTMKINKNRREIFFKKKKRHLPGDSE